MILNLGPYGQARDKVPPLFTVTGGTYEYAEETAADGTVNWELALLTGTNATLTFSRVVDYVDVFLVGGGQEGQAGGKGGSGGTRIICSDAAKIAVHNGSYPFTIGGGGEATTIFEQTAETGGGSAGGTGAGTSRGATKGTDGEYAFGNEASLLYSGRKYGAGGGGGGYNHRTQGHMPGAAGGETGGGKGSSNGRVKPGNGEDNTGAGGGGRYWDDYAGISSGPGDGGSGIIIIRNAR